MFTLVLIDDDIPVQPADLRDNCRAQLKRQIQHKYVDRVIPNVGLCIEFYDFVRIKDAHIHPGDGSVGVGEAYFKVEFKIVVFQPAVGEWLVGSITGSCKEGLRVSLSFFQDVLIPSSNLKTPFLFDAAEQCWVWQWRNQETNEVINFFYEQNALIRFRVIAVEFPEASGPQDKAREASMKIVGAVDRDGLGCVSWWPEGIPFNNAAPQSLTALLSPLVVPLANGLVDTRASIVSGRTPAVSQLGAG